MIKSHAFELLAVAYVIKYFNKSQMNKTKKVPRPYQLYNRLQSNYIKVTCK